jgi:hypothetical protein
LEKVGNPRHKKKFRERICVGSSGACRPNVPTFGCRANMSPTCRQLSQPRSDCNVHPGAGPVGESFYCCMNCTIKFHSCITCSGVQFGDWISPVLLHAASSVSTLSQCGQENFDHTRTSSPCCLGAVLLLPEEHRFEHRCGLFLRRCHDCTCLGELRC